MTASSWPCGDPTCDRPDCQPSSSAARDGDSEGLRTVLLTHHPIMRSETGPFSGCRCGQVGLGQDVIGHVAEAIRAALDGA